MTRQESFKKRVRARMARTGERYTTARQALLTSGGARPGGRSWASPPETAEESLRQATGRGWDEWCDVIEGWPGHHDGHTGVAAHLQERHGLDGWWAQTVTVGWERITGRRLPHQRADGTFAVGRTATVTVDADHLRALLLDDGDRADLFPGVDTALRSRPTSKAIRLTVGPGTAIVAIEPRSGGRARIAVQHEKLPTADDVERWRFWWSAWLGALDEG